MRRNEGWSSPDKRVPDIPLVEHANDTADARMLLSALGLIGGEA